MQLLELNSLDDGAAVAAFLRCCGSSRWANAMAASRPFASVDSMKVRADAVWRGLARADWLEAFSAHPKIGAGRAGGAGKAGGAAKAGGSSPDASDWSRDEQASVAHADRNTLDRLAAANREYEARFGYIFIVCATGRSAGEMLALLEGRLGHDADDELAIAAEQQRQITQLRLAKLLGEEPDTTR